MTEFLQSQMQKLNNKRIQDLQYLNDMFEGEKCRTRFSSGTIVKIAGDEGWDNYKNNVYDPKYERTLAIHDERSDEVFLFFEHVECIQGSISLFKGVDIVDSFTYNTSCNIYKKKKPANLNLSHPLQKLLLMHETEKFGTSTDVDETNADEKEALRFFAANFQEGGMMPIKNIVASPKWKQKYRPYLETKKVYMCKSCMQRCNKNCCIYYSVNNRKQVTMAVGWHMETKVQTLP